MRSRFKAKCLNKKCIFLACVVSTALLTGVHRLMPFLFGIDVQYLSASVRETDMNFDNSTYFVETKFASKLKEHASEEGLIYLASADSGYIDMAYNLYETSLRRHDIRNFLFVGSDQSCCDSLTMHGIQCFVHIHDPDAEQASQFGTAAFRRKTHIKTKIVLDALAVGLTVILTDVDIVFFKNPKSFFTSQKCDIEISDDIYARNSGFFKVWPTVASKILFRNSWEEGRVSYKSNQNIINKHLKSMATNKSISERVLSKANFANGRVYFELGGRMFKEDKPCKDCVIVHNNWIESSRGKVYRFKEHGMWEVDENNYYSDPNQKYVTFDLPNDYGKADTPLRELNALKFALCLGRILNRIVILPRFHCYGCKYNKLCEKPDTRCNFAALYSVDNFEKHFDGLYRESVFLDHHKVPDLVKKSLSPIYFIRPATQIPEDLDPTTQVLRPRYPPGPTEDELKTWLSTSNHSVLRFHSLYDLDYKKLSHVLPCLQADRAFSRTDDRQQVSPSRLWMLALPVLCLLVIAITFHLSLWCWARYKSKVVLRIS